jgi:hypothetical protein
MITVGSCPFVLSVRCSDLSFQLSGVKTRSVKLLFGTSSSLENEHLFDGLGTMGRF